MKNSSLNTSFSYSFTFLLFSYLMTGCASVGTSVGFNDNDNEYFVEDISHVIINTKVATKTDAEIDESDNDAIDEEKESDTRAEKTIPQVEEAKYREAHTSSRGYWRAALQYLQTGNEDDARWALENALAIKPKSKIANELMYQLDVDAINALGAENFNYEVQYGDSLSKLSKLFLNDSLRFYLLAKYNDIPDPSRLVVGQVIQIPGKQKVSPIVVLKNVPTSIAKTNLDLKNQILAPVIQQTEKEKFDVLVVNENKTTVNAVDILSKKILLNAKALMNEGDNLSAAILIENSGLIINDHNDVATTLVAAYTQESKQLIKNKRFFESKKYLNRVISLEPDNNEANMMLIDMNEIDEADLLYDKGKKAFESHDLVNAHALIVQALEIRPDYQEAIMKKEEVEVMLVQLYYKQALMAQRKHELDAAIKHWDSLLMINANNDNAKLYRAKAVSLKMKLARFVSKK